MSKQDQTEETATHITDQLDVDDVSTACAFADLHVADNLQIRANTRILETASLKPTTPV